ncbi:MAG TPA: hypothetical protein VGL61_06965 [Kofleriaceae bacterium]
MIADLQAESAQLERILGELRELVNPAAWLRIEQALSITTRLYGAGLANALEHATAAGAGVAQLSMLIDADELLASLLVLHGLHPLSTDARVRRTMAALATELGCALDVIELGPTRLTLRANGELGGAMSARVAEGVIRHALEAAAPELAAVDIVGLPVPPDPSLVQLRARREAP